MCLIMLSVSVRFTLFPYTTLFRSAPGDVMIPRNFGEGPGSTTINLRVSKTWSFGSEGGSRNAGQQNQGQGPRNEGGPRDRKSTRLNSSHLVISYAVFCLKKKTARA